MARPGVSKPWYKKTVTYVVAGLALVGYIAYKNWDKIKSMFHKEDKPA